MIQGDFRLHSGFFYSITLLTPLSFFSKYKEESETLTTVGKNANFLLEPGVTWKIQGKQQVNQLKKTTLLLSG